MLCEAKFGRGKRPPTFCSDDVVSSFSTAR